MEITFTEFDDQENQREIEKALTIDFCIQRGGTLEYENNRPYLRKKNCPSPLAVSHTQGLHLISEGIFGLDVELKNRRVVLKPEWIPKELAHLELLKVFIFGESIVKLNIGSFAEIVSTLKIHKVSKNKIDSSLKTQRICSQFYEWKQYKICVSQVSSS